MGYFYRVTAQMEDDEKVRIRSFFDDDAKRAILRNHISDLLKERGFITFRSLERLRDRLAAQIDNWRLMAAPAQIDNPPLLLVDGSASSSAGPPDPAPSLRWRSGSLRQ